MPRDLMRTAALEMTVTTPTTTMTMEMDLFR
jgi:hypothetical protein